MIGTFDPAAAYSIHAASYPPRSDFPLFLCCDIAVSQTGGRRCTISESESSEPEPDNQSRPLSPAARNARTVCPHGLF
jgi:hypothetical protein